MSSKVWAALERREQPSRPEVLRAALAAINEQFAMARGLLVRVMPPPDPHRSTGQASWRRMDIVCVAL